MAQNYITSGTHYSEQIAPDRTNWLRVDVRAFEGNMSHELEIKLYSYDSPEPQEIYYDGNIAGLIELVLLGKLYKEQLQKEVKV